jgi:purine-binding chemotaxis protein CheW
VEHEVANEESTESKPLPKPNGKSKNGAAPVAAPEDQLRVRLMQLESELVHLRNELNHTRAPGFELPTGRFDVLRFQLGGEIYGFPIHIVREIVRYVRLTRVTDVAPSVVGAVNVRGEILPVIDGRRRLSLPKVTATLRSSIVLVQHPGRDFGFVVDAVEDLISVQANDLASPNGALSEARCVMKVATLKSQVIQLLDVSQIVNLSGWERLPQRIDELVDAVNASPQEES